MRESGFRAFLSPRLGARSVDSYVAYCRRVERDLGIDLDACELSEVGLSNIRRQMETQQVAPASVRNCLSALKAYAEYRPSGDPTAQAMRITREQREAWAARKPDDLFGKWLDEQSRDEDGKFDLERLHALAERYGVSLRAEYAHLNSGQQRMNLGNRLRRIVPETDYAEGLPPSLQVSPPAAKEAPTPEPAPTLQQAPDLPASSALSGASVGDLLRQYGEIMDELRGRGIVRTGNSPVGDYAELLFAKAFGWTLAGNSAAGHDAVDAQGTRFQIKGRRLSSLNASRQLSAIRKLHDGTFDHLAAVLFDSKFKVLRAVIIPHAVVSARARRTDHTNSWTFFLDDKVWGVPGVQDVTADVAVAASTL